MAQKEGGPRLVLEAETAADLMTPNPVSIRDSATVAEAITLLTDKGVSAVPVIDQAGRPVGVLSKTDIVVHDREKALHPAPASGPPGGVAATGAAGDAAALPRVRDLMTPAVFSVRREAPAGKVVEEMLGLNVHQLFVVDPDGVLTGVISALDVLRRLRPSS
jgi:CBS domain-containing protein